MNNRKRVGLAVTAGLVFFVAALLVANLNLGQNETTMTENSNDQAKVIIREEVADGTISATFAGGCFWCTEAAFQETDGVTNSISGYAGGEEYDPTYKDVYSETTGHREALRVYYYSDKISYEELLEIFWRSIDPTDGGGQFVDRGMSYTTAIFYENDEQKAAAEKSKKELEESGRFDKPIATKILPFTTFYEAEDYHQDFYKKSPDRYKSYSGASGREEFKDLVWGEIQKSEN